MSPKRKAIISAIITIASIVVQIISISTISKYGPEALAYYNLIEIAFAIVPAAILIGGDSYFQYKINRENNQIKYFKTYSTNSIYTFLFAASFFTGICITTNKYDYLYLLIASTSALFTYLISYYERSKLNLINSTLIERLFFLVIGLLIISIYFLKGERQNINFGLLITASSLPIAIISIKYYRKTITQIKNNVIVNKYGDSLREKNSAIFFWGTSLTIFIYEKIDQLIAINLFGLSELGIYFACFKLSFVARIFSAFIYTQIYPYLTKFIVNDTKKTTAIYSKSMLYVSAITFTICLPLLIIPEHILSKVYDESFSKYSSLLIIITFGVILSSSNQINTAYLNSIGDSKFLLLNSIIAIIIQISIITLNADTYGLYALAWSRVIASMIGFTSISYRVYKHRSKHKFIEKNNL